MAATLKALPALCLGDRPGSFKSPVIMGAAEGPRCEKQRLLRPSSSGSASQPLERPRVLPSGPGLGRAGGNGGGLGGARRLGGIPGEGRERAGGRASRAPSPVPHVAREESPPPRSCPRPAGKRPACPNFLPHFRGRRLPRAAPAAAAGERAAEAPPGPPPSSARGEAERAP